MTRQEESDVSASVAAHRFSNLGDRFYLQAFREEILTEVQKLLDAFKEDILAEVQQELDAFASSLPQTASPQQRPPVQGPVQKDWPASYPDPPYPEPPPKKTDLGYV